MIGAGGTMRRALLLALAVAAAVPATASAKEITGVTLCGPDGCRSADVTGFGHEDPFSGVAQAPPPGAYLTASLSVDGDGSWRMFYLPREGLMAFEDGETHTMRWMHPDPRLASALKRTARGLPTYPGPRLTAVTVGERRIEEGAASYLALLAPRASYADPGSGRAERIHFEAVTPSPWTEADIYYFPETDVVAGVGTWFRLPSATAANVEAGRPLDASPRSGWTRPLLVAGAAALLLVAVVLLLRRRLDHDELAAPAATS
jgi:hypothetical protein